MQLSTSSIKVEAEQKRLGINSLQNDVAFAVGLSFGFQLAGAHESDAIIFCEFENVSEVENGIRLSATHKSPSAEISALLRIEPHESSGIVFTLSVENLGKQPIRVERLMPLRCAASDGGEFSPCGAHDDLSVFKMGWQSWSATRAYKLRETVKSPWLKFMREMEENPANRSSGVSGHFVSEQMCVVSARGGEALGLGFLTCKKAFGDVAIKKDTDDFLLEASCRFDGIALAPGQTFTSEPLWIDYCPSADDAAQNWASYCGKAMDARVTREAPVGWCSWYHYYTRINTTEMRKNLKILTGLKDRLSLKFMQLDDGYQSAIGDWLTHNQKFPSGVKNLMADIKAQGFAPGIWTAPFIARPKSKLFLQHPEWFLKNEKGGVRSGGFNPLWGGRVYALDSTHPQARQYVYDVFKIMREDWGVEFFKIDFVYGAALPAKRYDPDSTRASALRLGLETIREAIGDAFLLGCGCPLGPAVGIVDAMRIGCDVTPKWDNPLLKALAVDENVLSTRHALRNVMSRAFMHGRLWINDPDCLMIRRRKSRLSLREIRSMASVYAVTGGMLLLSDDMELVDDDRLELAQKTIALRTKGARVIGLADSEFPDTAAAETDGGFLVLVANWEDAPVLRSIDLSNLIPYHDSMEIVEVWTDEKVTAIRGRCDLGILQAHETKLLQILRR